MYKGISHILIGDFIDIIMLYIKLLITLFYPIRLYWNAVTCVFILFYFNDRCKSFEYLAWTYTHTHRWTLLHRTY